MDIAIISLLPGLIFLYLLKRHADRLEETDRKRIVDLLVVGYVMGSSGIISGSTNRALTIAGGIIFIYGFSLLLYKSFKQGFRESMEG